MKKRTLSALIIFLVIIPFLLIGGKVYAVGVGLISLLAFRELMTLKYSNENKLSNSILAINLVAFILLVYSNYDGNNLFLGLNYQFLGILILLTLIPVVIFHKEKYTLNRALRSLGLIFLVGLGFNMLITVFNYDRRIFYFLISIGVFTDLFAYISGMLIGKHKLIPELSPKKTWEGAIFGTILGTTSAIFLYINLIGTNQMMFRFVLITVFLSIVGQLGDLFFSAVKREYKIKDFSNLIPGHGGILDRLDSVIFIMIGYLVVRMFI
ncbi:MAG: phosphatidate cytidylyltransferase [Mollicutes bacterium]|nr:phosphatidate cytidylyltransferase [Mollicutes bacterium]